MLSPVQIENNDVLIHSFRAVDIEQLNLIAADVLSILSDNETLQYLPEKRLHSIYEAEQFLKHNLFSFHSGKNYLHFVRDKASGKVVGFIDIISPEIAKEHYTLDQYPHFIEFYLKGDSINRKIMSTLIPSFIQKVVGQIKSELGAVVNKRNISARKVLDKSGFVYQSPFDALQDLYIVK